MQKLILAYDDLKRLGGFVFMLLIARKFSFASFENPEPDFFALLVELLAMNVKLYSFNPSLPFNYCLAGNL
jgi:hypothetical protein